MTAYQTRFERGDPISLSKNPPTSNELLSSVKLYGQVLQALDALELQKSNLLRDRAKLRQVHNRWITPPPISQLPPELLSYIFLFVDGTRPNFKEDSVQTLFVTKSIFERGKLPAPVLLSHICTDWRIVALGTASMWNWIDVRGGEASLSRVGTWLARSGGLPLHLHVLLKNPHHPSDIANILHPYLQRIMEMQILVLSTTGIEFLPLLANASNPIANYQLRVLKVHYKGRNTDFSGAFLPFLEHQRALFSRLDLLILNGVGISGWPSWRVEKVHIHLMVDPGASMTWYKVFGAILVGLPVLKELHIDTLHDLVDGTPDQVLPSIARFPNLARIKVRAQDSTLRALFPLVDAPSLSSLEIEWWNSFDDDTIPSVMTEFIIRHPSLRRLIIVGGSGGPIMTNIQLALPSIPRLEHLKVERMYLNLGLLRAVLLDAHQALSVQLDSCFVTTPHASYPGATDATVPFLMEADVERLARDLSERDITLVWGQTSFGFEA
ncbi:hypothetical protein FRC01_005941 [Tulasnella sp. 417]|nr:hypothetical protein FRC01_005941 [Tulasnella sp. 417]